MHFFLTVTHLKRFCFCTPPQWVWNWSSRNETERLNWRWKALQSSGSGDWRQLQRGPHRASEGRKLCTCCFPQFQTSPGNCAFPGTLSYYVLTLIPRCLRNIFLKLFHSNLKKHPSHLCYLIASPLWLCGRQMAQYVSLLYVLLTRLIVHPLVFFFFVKAHSVLGLPGVRFTQRRWEKLVIYIFQFNQINVVITDARSGIEPVFFCFVFLTFENLSSIAWFLFLLSIPSACHARRH